MAGAGAPYSEVERERERWRGIVGESKGLIIGGRSCHAWRGNYACSMFYVYVFYTARIGALNKRWCISLWGHLSIFW